MHVSRAKMLMLSSGFAAALAVAACGGANNAADKNAPGGTPSATGTSGEQKVTLTGCLQKGSGMREYILTQASRTGGAVGTSGTASESNAVQREQTQAAARSYRLGGNTDQLDDLVGKQVRVTGRITDQANLGAGTQEPKREPANESAAKEKSERRDIDAGDLARVDVDSADKVSDNCSNSQAGSPQRNP